MEDKRYEKNELLAKETPAAETMGTEEQEKERKRFSVKKKAVIALSAVVALALASLAAMFFLKVDYMEARQKVLGYTGPNSQIISGESENEFLFLNEYSFEVYSDNGYYEIDMDPFGNITSAEYSKVWH